MENFKNQLLMEEAEFNIFYNILFRNGKVNKQSMEEEDGNPVIFIYNNGEHVATYKPNEDMLYYQAFILV